MKHYTPEDVAETIDHIIFGECTVDEARKLVADLINAAVIAEREACAVLCDQAANEWLPLSYVASHPLTATAKAIRARGAKEAGKYGCHCDLEPGMAPDDCVIGTSRVNDCIHAAKHKRKEECEYWQPVKEG